MYIYCGLIKLLSKKRVQLLLSTFKIKQEHRQMYKLMFHC